jgi:hypothetical protein
LSLPRTRSATELRRHSSGSWTRTSIYSVQSAVSSRLDDPGTSSRLPVSNGSPALYRRAALPDELRRQAGKDWVPLIVPARGLMADLPSQGAGRSRATARRSSPDSPPVSSVRFERTHSHVLNVTPLPLGYEDMRAATRCRPGSPAVRERGRSRARRHASCPPWIRTTTAAPRTRRPTS